MPATLDRLDAATETTRRLALGRVLHLLRQQRDWTPEEAASAAGVAAMTFRRLEDGGTSQARTLAAIDTLLGVERGTVRLALGDDARMIELLRHVGAGVPDDTDPAEYLTEYVAHVPAPVRARSRKGQPAAVAYALPFDRHDHTTADLATELLLKMADEKVEPSLRKRVMSTLAALLPALGTTATVTPSEPYRGE